MFSGTLGEQKARKNSPQRLQNRGFTTFMFSTTTNLQKICRTDYFYFEEGGKERLVSHTNEVCDWTTPTHFSINFDSLIFISGVFVFLITLGIVIQLTKVRAFQ